MSGTLGTSAIGRARVQIPAWGCPWADVDLPTPAVFAIGSAQTLTVADASFAMTVVSGGVYEGRASYRLVGGRGKWGTTVPAKSYANDADVKASTVLGDVAAACGETIADAPTTRMGPHYARANAPASEVLHVLAPRNWYVDNAGTTRIGQRPVTTYAGGAPRTHVDMGAGIVEIATDNVAALIPGVVVDGAAPALDVEYILDPKRVTVRVWAGPSATSRLVGALGRIVAAFAARERYSGHFEFRVVTQDGDRLNLQPVRASSGFTDLARVPIRPGVAGTKGSVQLGELVLVVFVDKDPSRPVVVAHDAPDAPGWMPLTIELGGPAALGVARMTDAIVAGAFAGTIVGGSVRVKAAL